MRFFLQTLLLAYMFSLSAGESLAQGGTRQQDRRGAPAPMNRNDAERRVRELISSRMRSSLSLPDSQFNKLISVSFRYRDSTLQLRDHDRIIRGEMNREMDRRSINQDRVSCLLGLFWTVQQNRLNVRKAEDQELATFLNASSRLRYMALQDNLNSVMDDVIEQMNERIARGGGGGGRSGPPPAGRSATGGGRSGGPPGARGGPAGFVFNACPPSQGG